MWDGDGVAGTNAVWRGAAWNEVMRVLLAVLAAAFLTLGCKTITEEDSGQTHTPEISGAPTGVTPIPARPTPSPDPSASDEPTPDPPNSDFIPDNDKPVAWVRAKVYFLECNGSVVPASEHSTEAAVGCRIHLDATPKDSSDKPTRAKGPLLWSYGGTPASYAGAADADYTPTLTVLAPGELVALATVDGITSNTVRVLLR